MKWNTILLKRIVLYSNIIFYPFHGENLKPTKLGGAKCLSFGLAFGHAKAARDRYFELR